ncbi:MAG: aconitase/3-isopropylmalate dehydratase large subunit family protein [Desulfitobacteriaceae bacterium]
MSSTIVEKIFSTHTGREMKAGDLVVTSVDLLVGTDTKTPSGLRNFFAMGLNQGMPSRHVALVLDHYVPCPHEQAANGHAFMRRFALEHGCFFAEAGTGVSHQVVPESGLIQPGQLMVAADSHAATVGGLNVLGLAVGSSEFAAILATGKMWFKVPESIRFNFWGHVPERVDGKDLALHLAGLLGENGANYQCIEFGGTTIKELSVAERMNICNHMADLGAKTAIMPADEKLRPWLSAYGIGAYEPSEPDQGASYIRTIDIDVSRIEPMVAFPHRLDNVRSVTTAKDIEVHMAYIGGCTNGRLEDLKLVARILAGKKVAAGVRLFIVPASRKVYTQALKNGIVEILTEAGAVFLAPGCALCVGLSGQGIPADGENVISTANRNFRGRLGNKKADIYLASPATVAVSALNGRITDPRLVGG